MAVTIKQEIIELVMDCDNNDLLILVKESLAKKNKLHQFDDILNEDFEDLKQLIAEPFGVETISQNEFNENLKSWRNSR